MPLHECAAPRCRVLVGMEQLMCVPHWEQVPKLLRDDIYRRWRDYQRRPNEEHVRAHRRACDNAIQSLHGTPDLCPICGGPDPGNGSHARCG